MIIRSIMAWKDREHGLSQLWRQSWYRLAATQSLLLSTRGFADQIKATLEKAAAVPGANTPNPFLANELEGS